MKNFLAIIFACVVVVVVPYYLTIFVATPFVWYWMVIKFVLVVSVFIGTIMLTETIEQRNNTKNR